MHGCVHERDACTDAYITELDIDLRDEAEIDEVGCEGGMRGDEACVASHQFNDGARAITAGRLDVAVTDDGGGGFDGGLEAEGAVEEEYVVVDRLGHPHDGDLKALLLGLLKQQMAGVLRAISADHEEHGDAVRSQRGHALLRVKAATPRLEH